jgi:DNA-binding winged helix-turn-helix (wHTH) protein
MEGPATASLRFDRFTLDLARGCLRAGDQDIHLRPKAFDVIRHLAENAGRLVSKEELHDTVWPGVVVSDDSLVQCIRELRQKLGDDGQRLIKTVPRRGYRLDSAATRPPPGERSLTDEISAPANGIRHLRGRWRRRQWVVGVSSVTVALFAAGWLAATLVAGPVEGPATSLFTDADARQVAKIAEAKRLPLPEFRVRAPSDDVRGQARRLVGIWVSDTGWLGSGRQLMVIVTRVERDGFAVGYAVHGPARPGSRVQSPPHVFPFRAQTTGRAFSFEDGGGRYAVSFSAENRMQIEQKFPDGMTSWVTLDPVWTFADAEERPRT